MRLFFSIKSKNQCHVNQNKIEFTGVFIDVWLFVITPHFIMGNLFVEVNKVLTRNMVILYT